MAASDAKPIPKKNVAHRVTFPIFDADGDLVTGAASLDSEVSKDGGTFTDCTNEATEIATSSGMYFLDLTADEMNADTVAIIVKTGTAGAKTTPIVLYPEEAGDVRVSVTQWNGTNVASPDTAGYPVVTVKDGTGQGEIATTSGAVDTVTTLTNLPAITSNWLTAAGIAAGALNGKGDWNIGKTGYALSAAGVQAIWDALTSALTTVGSVGKLIVDNLNATISSRSSHSAADVWASVTRTLTAATNITSTGAAVPITAGGRVNADATAISGDSVAADNCEAVFDGVGAPMTLRSTGPGPALTITGQGVANAATIIGGTYGVQIAAENSGIFVQGGLSGTGSGAEIYGGGLNATDAGVKVTGDNVPVLWGVTAMLTYLATAANQSTILNRLGAFTGSGVNTILGFLQALLRSDVAAPSDVGGTYNPATDSLEALQAEHDVTQGRLPAALVGGRIDANMGAISEDAAAADGLEAAFDGTGATMTLTKLRVAANDANGGVHISNSGGPGIKSESTGNNGHGIQGLGHGSGAGLRVNGGSSGVGLEAQGGSIAGAGMVAGGLGGGIGFFAFGSGGNEGIYALGQGAGAGLRATGGATGHGIRAQGGITSGDGINAAAQTAGDGIEAVGAGGGFDVNADIQGNLSGSIGSVGANGITATSIATDAIDADALAADAVTEIQSGLATAASITALNNLSAAQVNAEVLDVLNTDTFGEPTGVPAATATLATKVGYLYMALRNKVTVTATKKTFFDDSDAAEWEKDLSDDGTTYTETEGNAP